MSKLLSLLSNKVFVDQLHNVLLGVNGAALALGVAQNNPYLTGLSAIFMVFATVSSSINATKDVPANG